MAAKRKPTRRKDARAWSDEKLGCGCLIVVAIIVLGLSVAILSFFFYDVGVQGKQIDKLNADDVATVTEGTIEVKDKKYEWSYDASQDMQLPELPTGCEATAAGTLMRKNGIYVTKTQVADAMPRSSWDFVNCFLGDPYSENGYTCWAPCVVQTIKSLLPRGYVVGDSTGTDFADIRIPSYVYVTEDLEDPVFYSEDSVFGKGYKIAHNPHAMVVLGFDIMSDTVTVVDPLKEGIQEYSYSRMEEVYNLMGKQSVYIASVPIVGEGE